MVLSLLPLAVMLAVPAIPLIGFFELRRRAVLEGGAKRPVLLAGAMTLLGFSAFNAHLLWRTLDRSLANPSGPEWVAGLSLMLLTAPAWMLTLEAAGPGPRPRPMRRRIRSDRARPVFCSSRGVGGGGAVA